MFYLLSYSGCPPDYGLGKGVIFGSNPTLNCSPSGAHHTTYGGIGLPVNYLIQDTLIDKEVIELCYNMSTVSSFISDSFPYDSYHITEVISKPIIVFWSFECFDYVKRFTFF